MKWLIIIMALAVGYMVYTGNMGGATQAANNYKKVINKGSENAKPALIHKYLQDKPKGSLY